VEEGSWVGSAACPSRLSPELTKLSYRTSLTQGIALEEAKRMQLALPGLALANQFYVALQASCNRPMLWAPVAPDGSDLLT